MSFKKSPDEIHQTEDPQVEAALRHFRASVHSWGEDEFARARVIRPRSRASRFLQMPMLNWGVAVAIAVSGVIVPMEVRHQHQVTAAQQAATEQRQLAAQAATQMAQITPSANMTDEELLSHVDTDIAQAAPDAMEPLASLMNESTAR